MNIFKRLFKPRILETEPFELTTEFYRWWYKKQDERRVASKLRHMENGDYLFFEVHGSGEICISKSMWLNKSAAGLSFSVSWGDYPYVGGVIGYNEARKMAEFILERCNSETRPEAVILEEAQKERDKILADYKYPKK